MRIIENVVNISYERDPKKRLWDAVAVWSERINTSLLAYLSEADKVKLKDIKIIDCEGRINMRAFTTKRGGPYKKEDNEDNRTVSVARDEKMILEKEREFSGINKPEVFNHRKLEYKETDEQRVLGRWREENKSKEGMLAEAVIICVLNKFLGPRFIIVRTSIFDDYDNGVDTLILDKETGMVVCALDEVVGFEQDETRYMGKVNRVKNKLEKRKGMYVRYGLVFEQSLTGGAILKRTGIAGVPSLCISLYKNELKTLLNEADFGNTQVISQSEKNIFNKILHLFDEQRLELEARMSNEQKQAINNLIDFACSKVTN